MKKKHLIMINAAILCILTACGGGEEDSTPPPAGDSTAPYVELTSPSSDVTYTSARFVSIAATASDNSGITKVEFIKDDVVIFEDDEAPYQYRWSLDSSLNAVHSWTAKAYDAAGNTANSDAINLIVDIPVGTGPEDTIPPRIAEIESPSDGARFSQGGALTINATAEDDMNIGSVEFYINGKLVQKDTTPPYSHTVKLTSASNGSLTLLLKVYDEYGNSTLSEERNVTVDIPNSGGENPNEGVWSFASQRLVDSAINDLTLTLNDDLTVETLTYTFNSVDYSIPGTEMTRSGVDVDTDENIEIELDWGDDNGITFTGILDSSRDYVSGYIAFNFVDDSDIEIGTGSASITKASVPGTEDDTISPTVIISNPASGTVVTSRGYFTVEAQAEDNVKVANVKFYRNGVLRGTDSSTPFTFEPLLTAASNGVYSLYAEAIDTSGNVTKSETIQVTVDIPSDASNGDISGVWTFESMNMAFDSISDFEVEFDNAGDATRISYNYRGSNRVFTGNEINRGGVDLDSLDFDIEIDWDGDNSLVFGGRINSAKDSVDGIVIYYIQDGFDYILSEGNATVSKK
ncbi:hypothetical protein EKG38_07070 [Shewanella canadensis]|uniref:Ig-like domain-containing protein n=1 Tax=Shewanella canadensis TaxID=271096 RepID=A0A431WVT9_9GAMM|nr:Ig-like domain-containing protein [Shewanella canadensis]RTR39559.1 hypothetical protein EKG38_07070 [Shewanella canadensis]